MAVFVQATSSSTERLPHPLCLLQTCSSLKAQLREAETGESLTTSEAFPEGPGPWGLSFMNSQASEGQLSSVDTDHPHPPTLTTVVTTPCSALAVSNPTASACDCANVLRSQTLPAYPQPPWDVSAIHLCSSEDSEAQRS